MPMQRLFAAATALLLATGASVAPGASLGTPEDQQLPAVQKPKATLPAVQTPAAAKPKSNTGEASGDGSVQKPISVVPSTGTNIGTPTGPRATTPAPTKPMTIPGATGAPGIQPTTPAMKLPQTSLPPGALPTQPLGPDGKPLSVMHPPRAATPAPQRPGLPTATMARSFPAGTRFTTVPATWICEGNRCITNTFDLRRFYDACLPLAQQAGPVVSFRTLELSLNERELARCNSPVVREFHVTTCSGADDFRIGSSLKMSWDAGHGFVPPPGQPLSFIDNRIHANGCNYARTPSFGAGFPLVDLRALRFRFEGGRRTFTDAQDDWDMKSLLVQVTVARPGDPPINRVILRLEGNPLRRFEDVSQWEVDIPRQ